MGSPEDFFNTVNESAMQDLQNDARFGREWLLMRSGLMLRELLERQAFAIEFTDRGEELRYWVREETDEIPSLPLGRGPRSLSFLLQGFNRYQGRLERLKVHVPLPKGSNVKEPATLERLAEPDEIYAERLAADDQPNGFRVMSRFIINHERSLPYDMRDGEFTEIIEGEVDPTSAARPVPEELTRLARIRLDFVKFHTIEQRVRIIGEGDNIDL